ncbi:MAG: phage tail tape measure protein, partial [Clostridiaceae bacterium]|nr:phage tail tape measure protein [Clostridiaceae bacterium]
MSDLSILIKALLDPDSTKNIESQIKNLQTLFDKSPLKVKLDVDNAEFKAFSSNLQKLSTELNKSLNINSNTGGLDKYSEKFVMITGQAQKQVEYTKEFTNNLGQSVKEINKLDEEGKEVVKVLTTITDNFKQQRTEQEKLVEAMAKGREKAEAKRKALDRKAELAQAQAINKAKDEEYQKSLKIAEQQKKQLDALNNYKLKMLGDGKGIVGELDIFAEKNKGKFDPKILQNIRKEIEGLNIDTPELNNNIKRTRIEFSSLNKQAAQSGNIMARALENAMKFLRFYLVGGILVGVVRAFKDSISVVKELDDSLTELNKVADLTEKQLSNITSRAYEAGTALGRTGKEVIDATAEWVRAGYNIEDAFSLSQQSLLLTNIGDGITDVKEASSSLIAVLKGFKMEASDTAHVVDALNEVSNNFAIDTNNLTEILKRTSGTLAQTGTSYEQLIGLATGGYESLRSAEMVASGINMISQRLRGMSEEGESVAGLIPKIQEAFDKYTDGAVSIIDKQNGGLNDTYTILEQLSKVYPTLSEEARAYLNEAIAGNRQNKVLVAIMENWSNVEDAIVSATNSTGSALKENERYLSSISGKISQFKSATQQMWANAIDTNVVKFFVDLGTSIIKIVDGFGLLNTAIVVATVSLLLFNKGFLAFYNANLASLFAGLAEVIQYKLVSAFGMAKASAVSLAGAFTMIAPL